VGGRGSGGHNRKPAAVKKAEGNAGKRRINKREPDPPPADSTAPSTLTAVEKNFWDQIFPLVAALGVMRKTDVLALGQLCRFLAEEKECTEQLNRTGRLVPKKGDKGRIIGVLLNPLCRLRSDAARHVRAYLAVFGLGPSFRAALKTEDPDQDDRPQDPLENVRRAKAASDSVQ
jgi:P27 family predicted phage terminase small subunit